MVNSTKENAQCGPPPGPKTCTANRCFSSYVSKLVRTAGFVGDCATTASDDVLLAADAAVLDSAATPCQRPPPVDEAIKTAVVTAVDVIADDDLLERPMTADVAATPVSPPTPKPPLLLLP